METCPTCRYLRDHPNDSDNDEDGSIDDGDDDVMSVDDGLENEDDEDDDVEMLSEENARILEEIYEEAGLGRRSPGSSNACDDEYGDDDYIDDDYDDPQLACIGYKDLVFTGEVCILLRISFRVILYLP